MVKNAALVGCALSVALALIVALVAPVPALALPALPVPGAAGGYPGAYRAVQGSNAGAENSHLRIRVFRGPPTLRMRAGEASIDASPRAYVYVCTSVLVLIDEHIARIVDGQVQSYVTDALGTVRAVVDPFGVQSTYGYTAFGKLRYQTGPRYNPYLFTGRALDAKSGDYYFRARQYSPELGRFLAVDPEAPGELTYAYGNNNPLMYADPLGRSAWTVFTGLFMVGASAVIGYQGWNEATQFQAQKRAIDVLARQSPDLYGIKAGWQGQDYHYQLVSRSSGPVVQETVLNAMTGPKLAIGAVGLVVGGRGVATGVSGILRARAAAAEAAAVAAAASATQRTAGSPAGAAIEAEASQVLAEVGGTAGTAAGQQVEVGATQALQLTLKSGAKLGQQIARWREIGGSGGAKEFLEYAGTLASEAKAAGQAVTGTVGSGAQALEGATIFRRGSEYLVVQGGRIMSYVSQARAGGIVDEFIRLGGKL